MAHFAKVNPDNVVVNVVVADQEWVDSYIDNQPGRWIQTSYNTDGGVHYTQTETGRTPSADQSKALRKNYAGIGYTYSDELDAFIPPKPYPSWVLNEQTCKWESPTSIPSDHLETIYIWNEETLTWDERDH